MKKREILKQVQDDTWGARRNIFAGITLFLSICTFANPVFALRATPGTHNTIYLDWFAEDLRNDKLFNIPYGGFEWRAVRDALATQGYKITTYRYKNDKSSILCGTHFDMPSNLENLFKTYGQERCAVFLWEPPSVKPENFDKKRHKNIEKIFTWADNLVDNKKYFKFFYAQPNSVDVQQVPFEDKKFCCCLVANKHSSHPQELYTERLKTIMFFEQNAPQLFDLYGPGWQKSLRCYKGFVDDKLATLAQYKFCICYENIKDMPGYVSEKIHHCILTGCVPVYWGANNITDYIPAECFIDRRNFASNQELYNFLCTITQEEYDRYLIAMQNYLGSTRQKLFSNLYFADCLLKGFIKEYNRNDFFNEKQMKLLEKIDRKQQKIILKTKLKGVN